MVTAFGVGLGTVNTHHLTPGAVVVADRGLELPDRTRYGQGVAFVEFFKTEHFSITELLKAPRSCSGKVAVGMLYDS